MAQDHRLQQQRFELKYLVDDSITPAVRDFISSYLELDDYAVGRPNFSYPIHSLYLDSDDLRTFQDAINGAKNRFKLRVRYYDDRPNSPVFFEVKARVDNCILKQRCGVRRDTVSLLVAGQLPEPDHMLSREPRHLVTLEKFNSLVLLLNARPKAHNSYLREAWVSPHDNSVRVTMDREIRIEPCFIAQTSTEMRHPTRVFPESTILELKFTGRFPNWFRELVSAFNLMQASSAKYVEGVVTLGEARFHDGQQSSGWQGLRPRNYQPQAIASAPVTERAVDLAHK